MVGHLQSSGLGVGSHCLRSSFHAHISARNKATLPVQGAMATTADALQTHAKLAAYTVHLRGLVFSSIED